MARTTEHTYLTHSTDGTTYTKLVDIKEFPDLGGAPSTVDITTLSDHMKTYLNGLVDPGSLEFNCNFDLVEYNTLKALEGTKDHYFAVQCGKDGAEGIFGFQGELSVWVKGGSVEAAMDMGVAIAPSTEITVIDTAATIS